MTRTALGLCVTVMVASVALVPILIILACVMLAVSLLESSIEHDMDGY